MIEIIKAKNVYDKDVFYILKYGTILFDLTRYKYAFYSLHEVIDAVNSEIEWVIATTYVDVAKLKKQNNFNKVFTFYTFDDLRNIESTHPELFI